MTRALFRDAVLDRHGNGILATVEVRQPGTELPVADPLYDIDGNVLANPITTASSGEFAFYMDEPQRVDLFVTAIIFDPETRQVDVLNPVEGDEDVAAHSVESQPHTGIRLLTVKSQNQVAALQAPTRTIPAGTDIFKIDENGDITFGPNEILDKTPGGNYPVADFWYASRTRRLFLRSLILTEIDDGTEFTMGRASAPFMFAAGPVSAGAVEIPVTYAGTAFPSAGSLKGGVSYTGKTTVASLTVAGDQTITRDTPTTLTLSGSTAGFLSGGTRYARAGEAIIAYTGVAGSTLTGVTLAKFGARSSIVLTNGTTVQQDKLTGVTGVPAGGYAAGDTLEQASVYPVPGAGGHLAGLGVGHIPGYMQWRAWRNPAGTPPGSQNADTVGMAGIAARLGAYLTEPAYDNRMGAAMFFQTCRLGENEPRYAMDITHDGDVRIGPESKVGPNASTYNALAKLEVSASSASKVPIVLRMFAGQTARAFRLLDSADAEQMAIAIDGSLVLKHLAAYKFRNNADTADLVAMAMGAGNNQLLLAPDDGITQTKVYGDVAFLNSLSGGVQHFLLDTPNKEFSFYLGGILKLFSTDNAANSTIRNSSASDAQIDLNAGGVKFRVNTTGVAWFGGGAVGKQTVTGSRGGNAALESLLIAMAAYNLITNSTTT